jgi:hypothetical protein
MEYLIGSLTTLIAIAVVANMFVTKNLSLPKRIVIRQSQSHLFSLISHAIDTANNKFLPGPTQSTKHYDNSHIRVIFFEDKAYWISNNTFYESNRTDEGGDEKSTKAVDIRGMDTVQVDKMMFIVEQLTRGLKNDGSDSGK